MFSLNYDAQGVAIGYRYDPAGALTQADADAALLDDLNIAKSTRLASLSVEVTTLLADGYTCANGIKMDATVTAMQLLKSGYDLGLATSATSMDITDYNNISHAGVALADVWNMLLELGGYYQLIRSRKNIARTAISDATSAAAVQAVAL